MGRSDADEIDGTTERDLSPVETNEPDAAVAFAVTEAAAAADGLETQDDLRPVEARTRRPRLLDRYELRRMLGEGGMGEVTECVDHVLERTVALKSIRRDRQARHFEARFVREACVQAQLEHPSVVPVFEVGRDESGVPFFTMRKIEGVALDEVLRTKRLDDPSGPAKRSEALSRHQLLTAFAEVCLAVHYAHSCGVLHRDIKPSNIMLGEFGEVYILDWGVAKVTSDVRVPDAVASGARLDKHETVAGVALGTPAFMAPEQFTGREIDARADVFALGAVLFEILTLEPLLDDRAIAMRLGGKEAEWDARPSVRAPNQHVAPEFDRICVRATAKDAHKRYASARDLHAVIEAYLDGERDLELRTDLAASLVERAERTRLDDRDAALREVNRALALAPDNRRALELLVELLQQTPASTAKAREEVRSAGFERHQTAKAIGAPLLLVPWFTIYPLIVVVRGVKSLSVALVPPLAWCLASLAMYVDHRRRSHERVIYPTVLVVVAVCLTSILYGPLFLVPGAAVVCVASHVLVAARHVRAPTIALTCAGVVVSMIPVWLGLVDVYRFVDETTLSVSGVFSSFRPFGLRLGFTLVDFMMVAGVAYIAYRFRDGIERARTESVLFAWQLSKLLPPAVSRDESEPAPPSIPRGSDSVARILDTEVDAMPLRAVVSTTNTRAADDLLDTSDPPFLLLALDGSRFVDAEVVIEGDATALLRVRDRLVGRDVAMKRLRPGQGARALAALRREALLQARVAHPAVPPIYDLGQDDAGPWFTTKLVRGQPLSEIVRGEGASSSGRHQRLTAFTKVCLAIDFAHAQGIVHDALDPSTIVLGEFGEVYVLGWSHARSLGEEPDAALPSPPSSDYRAPERPQARASIQSDIFALGAILFEIVTGRPASSGERMPEALDEVCARAMARDPDARYRSARQLHDAIEAFLGGDRDTELRRVMAAQRVARAEKNLARAASAEAVRVEVLRDIGGALALAPDRSAALRLLSRMLESPPTSAPVEVEREIRAQIWEVSRRASPTTALVYVVLFAVAFPIYSVVVGIRDLRQMLAIVIAWLVAAAVVHGQHVVSPTPIRFPWAALVSLAAVGTTSLLFGPHLMVPGLAITITMVYVLAVQPEWRLLVIVAGCASLFVPTLLSWLGVLDAFEMPEGTTPLATLFIRGADHHPPWVFLVALVIETVVNVLVAGFYASQYRDMLDELEVDNRAKVHGLSRLL